MADLGREVWKGKWAEVTASFNSDDELEDEGIDEEVSLAANQRSEDNCNGNEIRRSARPRRIAAKAAQAEYSSMSDEDERPLKRRTSLSASVTPSSGKLEQRRLSDGQMRSGGAKLDEKRMRKRETNKNSARKMRLQRKEELNSLLQSRNELQDQLTAKAREQRASQSLLQSLEKDYSVLNSSYKRLAQSHDMLVMELLRHLTFLRNFSGKQLEPQAVSQMLAQFSQFLPSDERALPLGEPALNGARIDLPGFEISSGLPQNMDGGLDTVLIQVNPKPGTQVQIFRPKALRAQSGTLELSDEFAKTLGPQLPMARPRNGLSRQSSSPPLPLNPLSTSFPEQALPFHIPFMSPTANLPLKTSPRTPSSFAPPLRISPDLNGGTTSPAEVLVARQSQGPMPEAQGIQSIRQNATSDQNRAISLNGSGGPGTSQATSPAAIHPVIRPQVRAANGVTGGAAQLSLPEGSGSKSPDPAPRGPVPGPSKILSMDKHLSGFQPVSRMV